MRNHQLPRPVLCLPYHTQCAAAKIIQIVANGAPLRVREGQPPVMSHTRGRRGAEGHRCAHNPRTLRRTRCKPCSRQCIATNIIQNGATGAPWRLRERRVPSFPRGRSTGRQMTRTHTQAPTTAIYEVCTLSMRVLCSKNHPKWCSAARRAARAVSAVDIASPPNFSYRAPSPIERNLLGV